MPSGGKLPYLALKNGHPDVESMMLRLMEEHDSMKAMARALQVERGTVRYWLRAHGYVHTDKGWEKQTQPQLTAQSSDL